MSFTRLLTITLFIALGIASIAAVTTTIAPHAAQAGCNDDGRSGNCN